MESSEAEALITEVNQIYGEFLDAEAGCFKRRWRRITVITPEMREFIEWGMIQGGTFPTHKKGYFSEHGESRFFQMSYSTFNLWERLEKYKELQEKAERGVLTCRIIRLPEYSLDDKKAKQSRRIAESTSLLLADFRKARVSEGGGSETPVKSDTPIKSDNISVVSSISSSSKPGVKKEEEDDDEEDDEEMYLKEKKELEEKIEKLEKGLIRMWNELSGEEPLTVQFRTFIESLIPELILEADGDFDLESVKSVEEAEKVLSTKAQKCRACFDKTKQIIPRKGHVCPQQKEKT